MAYTKLTLRPGINREGTAYDNEGGWFDGNLIRFRNGHVEKFGGWEKLSSNTFLGTTRALHNWMSLGSNLYLGLGTTFKYYVKEGDVTTTLLLYVQLLLMVLFLQRLMALLF